MKKEWNAQPVTVNSGEQPADEKEKYADYDGNPLKTPQDEEGNPLTTRQGKKGRSIVDYER